MKGISRSATVTLAYLMWKNHWEFKKAKSYLKDRRPIINPNLGFRVQLEIWEKILKQNPKYYDLPNLLSITETEIFSLYISVCCSFSKLLHDVYLRSTLVIYQYPVTSLQKYPEKMIKKPKDWRELLEYSGRFWLSAFYVYTFREVVQN